MQKIAGRIFNKLLTEFDYEVKKGMRQADF